MSLSRQIGKALLGKPLKELNAGQKEMSIRLRQMELRLSDLARASLAFPDPDVSVATESPVAVTSNDHVFPHGTADDDTRYPRFCAKAERVLGPRLSFLDIGCSGGGLVFDFLQRGHFAIGIEGSDYSLLNQRAHWSLIPRHLFTCDATKPYTIHVNGSNAPHAFDLVSAWEVLEHIPEDALPQFFANVRAHLRPGGLFVASVATFEDRDEKTGAVFHVTIKPRGWWEQKLADAGLMPTESPFVTADFPRGSGNPLAKDWDAQARPDLGFHVVARAA